MSTWVLLRGLTREAAHWGSFVQQMAQVEPGARVITLDLPGAGAARGQPAPLQVQAMAEHCRGALRAAGAEPPYRLLGLSLGGMVASCWALRHPEEVSHCVLVNSSMRPLGRLHERLRPGCWPVLLQVLFGRDALAAEQRVLQWTSAQPAAHREVLAEWMRIRRERPVTRLDALRQLLAAARYRLPPGRPRARVLVLASAGDRLVNPVCSQRLAAQWGSSFALHPQAGHDLPLDAGDWVCERIGEWLATGPV
ncbi:MAG: alpha/beta hydrolase [Pseudomonadota bacterium]